MKVTIIFNMILLLIISSLVFSRRYYLDNKQEIVSLMVEATQGLVTNSRNYILTGNTEFKNRYDTILKVAEGNEKWEKLTPHPWFNNKTQTLRDIIKIAQFSKDETDILDQMNDLIEGLIWDEITAMNNYDGRVDIDNKFRLLYDELVFKKFIKFSEKQPERLQELRIKSVNMLFGKEYIEKLNELTSLEYLLKKLYYNRIKNVSLTLDLFVIFLVVGIYAFVVYLKIKL